MTNSQFWEIALGFAWYNIVGKCVVLHLCDNRQLGGNDLIRNPIISARLLQEARGSMVMDHPSSSASLATRIYGNLATMVAAR